MRHPIDPLGLVVRPLYTEPRVAVLPADHRLAGKEAVALFDLAAEHLLQDPGQVPGWRAVATELRTGRPAVPVFLSVEEKLEHVAAGRGVIFLPLSVMTFYTRPDIAYVPVPDLAPNEVSLAWPADRQVPLAEEFALLAAQ
ncbi:LysR substrate-binding domain-containing protein [Nocardia yunnanensis]|uniref:LysR substrate-binding domain-containing protein n=1 Tax=Nocardia yunnanensis TaxID=2382165 RepID=UPI001CA4316F|nr:LysR substrate-binding domain-containing protein [Nocardia yunnanensis]